MVSFWDAVETTFTRDPREARAYILADSSPVSSFDSFIGGAGEDRQRDIPVLPPDQQRRVCRVNARTKALSSLPLKIYSKRLNRTVTATKSQPNPARDIWTASIPFWTFTRWMDADRTGRSACGASRSRSTETDGRGRPVEMWWARSDRVTVHHRDEIRQPLHVRSRCPGARYDSSAAETLWLRYPNINNQWAGLSPLGAARLAADTSSAAMKTTGTYLPTAPHRCWHHHALRHFQLTEEQGTAAEVTGRKFRADNAHPSP